MLSILTQAYQGTPLDKIAPLGTLPAKQQEVFTTYVQRMLSRRGSNERYTKQQTIHWLSWLARQLVQHRQTEFSLEQIQPDWLPDRRIRWFYSLAVMIAVGLIFGLLFALALGPIFVLRYGLAVGLTRVLIYVTAYVPLAGLIYRLDDRLMGGPIIGLIGLAIKLVAGSKVEIRPTKRRNWSWTKVRRGLAIGLILGAIYGFLGSRYGAINGLIIGLLGGIVYGLVSALTASNNAEIRPVEVFGWSWVKMRRGFIIGLAYGSIIGLGMGLLLSNLVVCPIFGILCALIYGLIKGLSSETLPKNAYTKPNQGIRRSMYNSISIGLITWLFTGLIIGLATDVSYGLFYGLYFGLVMGLQYGGDAAIKHGVLRLFLWRAKFVPWNYIRFLDYTTERILLRRVGGSYIFIHRLLLEHFATVNIMPEHDKVPTHK
jgi:hypothetical protein